MKSKCVKDVEVSRRHERSWLRKRFLVGFNECARATQDPPFAYML